MAHDFDLKNILKRTPVDEELEDLKNMVLAKVEKLEARNAETKDVMEVEAPRYQDFGSSSDDDDSDEEVSDDEDSDTSSDDDEPPSKKPCYPSGPVNSTAQRTSCEGLATSKTAPKMPRLTIKVPNSFAKRPPQPLVPAARNPRNLTSVTSHPLEPVAPSKKLTIKVPNPFAKKSTQPLVPAFGNPQKASPQSATPLLSDTDQTIDENLKKRRVERNEEKKHTAKVFKLDDPCMKRPKYKIPRKPVSFQPTNSAKAHEEEPNWPPFEKLKNKVLAKIEELEAAYEQKTEKAEEKVNPDALKTSRFEKKPRKRPAESHGSMEPPAKRSMGSKAESSRKSDDCIPKKRLAPSRPSQVAQPQMPAKPAKTTPIPQPAAPIITSSSCMGFKIPKKKVALSSAPEAVMIQSTEPAKDATKPLPPTVSVKPTVVPLLSLVLERPTWLGEKVLSRY